MKHIIIEHNLFTPIGINHLLQANWSNLKHLGLCNNYLMKGEIKWELKDVDIYQKVALRV